MVNIIVLGGTGPTGLATISEALDRGYTVVVYARSPQKIPPEITSHPLVVIVKGSLDDENAIAHCFTLHRKDGHSQHQSESEAQFHFHDPSQPLAQSQVQSQGPGHTVVDPNDAAAAAAATHEETIQIDAIVSALGPPVTGIHPRGNPLAKGYEKFIQVAGVYGVKRFVVLGTASIKDEFDKFDIRFKTLVFGVHYFAPHAFEDIVAIGKTFDATENVDWTIVRVPVLVSRSGKEYHAGYIGDGKTKTVLTRSLFAQFVCDEVEHPKWIRERPLLSWID